MVLFLCFTSLSERKKEMSASAYPAFIARVIRRCRLFSSFNYLESC
ncbi:hypothetical protein HMPREF0658_0731 [Hoylesella marshii DSM 16973 = JCM 13450]|uniref:Uncharacterized protein n=1 Tax=Hoylesella marshii DSM 16973 = JCM 13450 TaxID=862515 RepID=E0NRD0_9BACT|nr:hypothetical protein HMPREF0658_0731 [Hoylesella marshii DSM 16973 = JCM 13450]